MEEVIESTSTGAQYYLEKYNMCVWNTRVFCLKQKVIRKIDAKCKPHSQLTLNKVWKLTRQIFIQRNNYNLETEKMKTYVKCKLNLD